MTTTRRSFLRITGLAAASLTVARGAAAGAGSSALQRFSSTIHPRAVARHGALALVWLHGGEPGAGPSIATLDEAQASGALLITEQGSATVPELIVDNRGKAHVLLLAGEILVGGKQNRVLREDILLPPLSGPRALGVYCVEQGRWNEGKRDFESKSTFAHPALRREVYDKVEQGRVWSEVARSTRAAAAPSSTGSYQQVYEQPAVREHLDEAERGLDARVSSGALGAAVFVGPNLSGIDVFRDPSLFAREWRKLLRAYAVEAHTRSSGAPAPEAKQRAEVQRVLTAATMAAGLIHGNAGVGQVFEFKLQDYRGTALGYEGTIVHAAIL
jgi:hypothetical protein